MTHSYFVVLSQDFSDYGDDDFDGDEDAGENEGTAEGATPTSGIQSYQKNHQLMLRVSDTTSRRVDA